MKGYSCKQRRSYHGFNPVWLVDGGPCITQRAADLLLLQVKLFAERAMRIGVDLVDLLLQLLARSACASYPSTS